MRARPVDWVAAAAWALGGLFAGFCWGAVITLVVLWLVA